MPGKYTVKLTAAGKTLFAMLTVKMDPRVKTNTVDLVKQFQLASALAASSGEISTATQQADDLLKQIAARSKDANGNAEAAAALADLQKKIGAVAGAQSGGGFGGFGLAAPGDEPKSLRQASAALSGLLGVVESADTAPTADASGASAKWEAAAKMTLGRWEDLKTKDVVRVNSVLEKAHLQPLKIG